MRELTIGRGLFKYVCCIDLFGRSTHTLSSREGEWDNQQEELRKAKQELEALKSQMSGRDDVQAQARISEVRLSFLVVVFPFLPLSL